MSPTKITNTNTSTKKKNDITIIKYTVKIAQSTAIQTKYARSKKNACTAYVQLIQARNVGIKISVLNVMSSSITLKIVRINKVGFIVLIVRGSI